MVEVNNELQPQEEQKQELVPQSENSVFKNSNSPTMWNDTKLMTNAWKMAGVLAQSTIVPQAYRGNAGNCLNAIDIANRMGLSPIMVMQNSQVVQGNFTWKGSACKGLIDNCGRFTKTRYVYVGERDTDSWGCYLEAEDKQTGETVRGAIVTIKMAKDEGWMSKNGSKWKTMPELMMSYRASTFFARTHCPQALMGFYTTDEMIDIGKGEPEEQVEKVKITLDSDDGKGED